mgnify:CR=1 FL=1
MKKRVKFKFQKKLTYTLLAMFVIVAVAIGINAYGTNNPSVLGHTFGELTPPTGCAAGQLIKYTGGSPAWSCVTVSSGGISGSGIAGRLAMFAEPNVIVETGVYSSGSGAPERIGIGKSPSAGIELDVSGDIKASGTICDGSGKCVGTSLVLDPTTYTAGDGTSSSMGVHKFCFLTQVTPTGSTGDLIGCSISEVSGSWTLSTGLETNCKARCVD